MTTKGCGLVWVKVCLHESQTKVLIFTQVLYTSAFLGGLIHGSNKQKSLYDKAEDQVRKEQVLLKVYHEEVLDRREREAAAGIQFVRNFFLINFKLARGEDVSIYDIPKGFRVLAKPFLKALKQTEEQEQK